MITVEQYLGQHSQGHEHELTPQISANARLLIGRVGTFITLSQLPGELRSGWRPAAVNAGIAGAAAHSKHQLGLAVDVADNDGKLRDYATSQLKLLERLGLWMEDPRCTPSWLHLQCVAPASGKRVFIPDATWAARLKDQPKFA